MTRSQMMTFPLVLLLLGCSSESRDEDQRAPSTSSRPSSDPGRSGTISSADRSSKAPSSQQNVNQDAGPADAGQAETTSPDAGPPAPRHALRPGQLAAGVGFSCAVTADQRRLACWGEPPSEDADEGSTRSTVGTFSRLPAGIVHVDASSTLGCVVTVSGDVHCWGERQSEGAESDEEEAPRVWAVPGAKNAQSLAIAGRRACAVTRASGAGEVRCWEAGEPEALEGLSEIDQVALSVNHLCARRSDGHVFCQGSNGSGQLGDASSEDRRRPVQVIGLSNATAIAVGRDFSCALRVSGRVACWGANDSGQLGEGTSTAARFAPVEVPGLEGVRAIEAGEAHVCALLEGGGEQRHTRGEVRCWGRNAYGQLGDGSTESRRGPVAVLGLDGTVVDLALADEHSCALLHDGRVFCWGAGSRGEVGPDSLRRRFAAAQVPGVTGQGLHIAGDRTCVRQDGAAPRCWGAPNPRPASGFLGQMPTLVGDLDDAGQVEQLYEWEVGRCELREGSRLLCSPRAQGGGEMVTLESVAQVAGNGRVVCARIDEEEDTIRCWRWTSSRRGALVAPQTTPTPISEIAGVLDFDVGGKHACVVLSDGAVRCWGGNHEGQLGDGSRENRSEPVAVAGVTGAVEVVTSEARTCARLESGRVLCWGGADSEESAPAEPEDVGLEGVSALVGGASHFCALLGQATEAGEGEATESSAAREVRCWGSNGRGQLGRPEAELASSANPVEIEGVERLVAIAAGSNHTCGQRPDNTVFCWGADDHGQLGRIPGWVRPSPRAVALPSGE